jgi:thiosulfate/3-mercaptopyruvate sulfurtransferase
VTYCNSGVQASQTYFVLKLLGYDVRLYDGSFSEWSQAKDAPVAKSE